jgi:polysaccharide export outer membrane protein
MRKSLISGFYLFAPIVLLAFTMVSCDTTRKIKYFQDIPDSGKFRTIPEAQYTPPLIRVGDILNINIEIINPMALSAGGGSSSTAGALSSGMIAPIFGNDLIHHTSDFEVDKNGNVELPVIGVIKVEGYSTAQLKDTIKNRAAKYFKALTVTVNFDNFKVSVLGEVLKPGQYLLPVQKENILDAIAMAGDLTVFGKRENVLLIRDNFDGTQTTYRINLKKSDIMSAPYYYLRQNDVIYVEPRKAKSDATDASQAKFFSLGAAVISIIIIYATRVK